MTNSHTTAVTGATGQLGRLVIADLLKRAPGTRVIGVVRKAAAAKDLAGRGAVLREADYSQPAALETAFAGVDKLLLV